MMRLYQIVFLFCVLAASCSARNNDKAASVPLVGPADNAGVSPTAIKDCADKVALFYGGRCTAVQRAETAAGGRQRILTLTLSGSRLMDSLIDLGHLTAANMAYIAYQHLPPGQRAFDVWESRLQFSKGAPDTFRFSTSTLKTVARRMKSVEQFVSLLAKNDSAGLVALIEDGPREFRKEWLVSRLLENRKKLGDIRGFVPYGFLLFRQHPPMLADTEISLPALQISGLMAGSAKQAYYYFLMSPYDGEAIWYALDGTLTDD